jgi:WD40 repeat protein
MWNADHNAIINTFAGHSNTVTCGDFTPDGTIMVPWLLCICLFIKLWFGCLCRCTYECSVPCEGKLICTGSDDASLRIWDPRSAQSRHVVQGKLPRIPSIPNYSPLWLYPKSNFFNFDQVYRKMHQHLGHHISFNKFSMKCVFVEHLFELVDLYSLHSKL